MLSVCEVMRVGKAQRIKETCALAVLSNSVKGLLHQPMVLTTDIVKLLQILHAFNWLEREYNMGLCEEDFYKKTYKNVME